MPPFWQWTVFEKHDPHPLIARAVVAFARKTDRSESDAKDLLDTLIPIVYEMQTGDMKCHIDLRYGSVGCPSRDEHRRSTIIKHLYPQLDMFLATPASTVNNVSRGKNTRGLTQGILQWLLDQPADLDLIKRKYHTYFCRYLSSIHVDTLVAEECREDFLHAAAATLPHAPALQTVLNRHEVISGRLTPLTKEEAFDEYVALVDKTIKRFMASPTSPLIDDDVRAELTAIGARSRS